jgi:hypothetical protein
VDAASQYALAYALTTTAGVRAVLSLAFVSVALHLGFLHAPPGFGWLAATGAMWSLIGVAVVEILADKVPLLDHAMHAVQVVVKPAAAAILVGGSVHAASYETLAGLMVLGALNALGVHAAIASIRGISTVATAGTANPMISTVEDGGAVGSLVLAFLAPFAAAALALVFSIALFVIARSTYRRVRAGR